jgi:hypothetical protein
VQAVPLVLLDLLVQAVLMAQLVRQVPLAQSVQQVQLAHKEFKASREMSALLDQSVRQGRKEFKA